LPYREQALIVSHWPQTSLPRDVKSIKRFENLQSLVGLILLKFTDVTVTVSVIVTEWLLLRFNILVISFRFVVVYRPGPSTMHEQNILSSQQNVYLPLLLQALVSSNIYICKSFLEIWHLKHNLI